MIRSVFRNPGIAAKFTRPIGALSRFHRFLSQVGEEKEKVEAEQTPSDEAEQPTSNISEADQIAQEKLQAETVKLAEEIELWKKEAARIQADAYNHAARLKKDKKNAEVYAIKRFAKDVLPVVDVLEKALEIENQTLDQLREGVQLTLKSVYGVLEKNSVSKIPSMGEKFDPNFHEVMFQLPNEAENGTIVQVIQEGYRLGEHTLRGAKVGVSSGPPE